uniref:Cytochrome b5 heme-binding domain-containing protein n=1 Tax=Chromera velia CCMP2878 TaxID=1169474 RepID=A0A0G4FKE0_9ALVE|eukprot:Cvel_17413.t1-p1 / transcript=Cvel_17413.t1 / gene=Cvel_17413 / organism=Chromera_velia_CCMP2878 / gene_product=Delta(5) fatty acid desaturase, putative / transcript_product=Delta(5) fatty acid desaturase, putative / location=Cvel_scaffold1387:18463-20657(-) / protein_length=543 / sequence_SO=supercontig / SO=protein_coding / is_pseudo=false
MTEVIAPKQSQPQRDVADPPRVWRIHGELFDLTPFLDHHPGGRDVLMTACNMEDASALFESYHALSNRRDVIWTQLQKFRLSSTYISQPPTQAVKRQPPITTAVDQSTTPSTAHSSARNSRSSADTAEHPTWMCDASDTTETKTILSASPQEEVSIPHSDTAKLREAFSPDSGLYRTLQTRVRAHFIDRAKAKGIDVRDSWKATSWWTFKVSIYACLFLAACVTGFRQRWLGLGLPFPLLVLIGFFQAVFHIACGFCVMHDASHYAVSSKPWVNELLSRLCNASQSWFHHVWARHHVYGHHSFTGDVAKDPDTRYGRPFFRKHPDDAEKKFLAVGLENQPASALIALAVFPGQFFGQGLLYLQALFKHRYIGIPVDVLNDLFTFEVVVILLAQLQWWVFQPWVQSLAYWGSLNILYWMCIAPDHDTWESLSLNKKKAEEGGDKEEKMDWGEMQVRESSNFAVDYPVVCTLFGGINYQIEHHLFPGVSHVHYRDLAPIVRSTCQEFGVPYQEFGSWTAALCSVVRGYWECGKLDSSAPKERKSV